MVNITSTGRETRGGFFYDNPPPLIKPYLSPWECGVAMQSYLCTQVSANLASLRSYPLVV